MSHLAAAIGLALVENGWRVLFMRTSVDRGRAVVGGRDGGVPRSRQRKPCNYDDRAAQNDGNQNDGFHVGYHQL